MQIPSHILLQKKYACTLLERLFIDLNFAIGQKVSAKLVYHHKAFAKGLYQHEAIQSFAEKTSNRKFAHKLLAILLFDISAFSNENGGKTVNIKLKVPLEDITEIYCQTLPKSTFNYVRKLKEATVIEMMKLFVNPGFTVEMAKQICPDIEVVSYEPYDKQTFQKCVETIMKTLNEIRREKQNIYNKKQQLAYVKMRAKYKELVLD